MEIPDSTRIKNYKGVYARAGIGLINDRFGKIKNNKMHNEDFKVNKYIKDHKESIDKNPKKKIQIIDPDSKYFKAPEAFNKAELLPEDFGAPN